MSKFPEILRSVQKDEIVCDTLSSEFSKDFCLKILGPRIWLKHKHWIEAFCHFVYFCATTLSDYQTLGEEYTGIVQVTYERGRLKLPSKFKRFMMIALQTLAPVFLKEFVFGKMKSEKKLILQEIVDFLYKANLLWFYLEGSFYHISKRYLDIEYAKLNPLYYHDASLKWIKYISILNGLVLTYQFYNKIQNLLKVKEERNTSKTPLEISAKKCPLCLEPRKDATSTTCGHIFCWICIHESVKSNPECPICREPQEPRKLCALINFS